MSVLVTLDQIKHLAPNAHSNYLDAFAAGQSVLDQFEISANPLRVAHFVAQMMHESVALTYKEEALNYSAERLPVVWKTRFQPKGPLDPAEYAHNPEKLANEVYARAELGNTQPGDGYKFRGRGLLQLTGRDSYNQATQILRKSFPDCPDFTADPDAVYSADWCLKVAAAEWSQKGCNAMADADDIKRVTKAINGAQIGIKKRTDWTVKTKNIWH